MASAWPALPLVSMYSIALSHTCRLAQLGVAQAVAVWLQWQFRLLELSKGHASGPTISKVYCWVDRSEPPTTGVNTPHLLQRVRDTSTRTKNRTGMVPHGGIGTCLDEEAGPGVTTGTKPRDGIGARLSREVGPRVPKGTEPGGGKRARLRRETGPTIFHCTHWQVNGQALT
jgi:hypothetical protein